MVRTPAVGHARLAEARKAERQHAIADPRGVWTDLGRWHSSGVDRSDCASLTW